MSVLDGQQRLTTISLLLALLRRRLEDGGYNEQVVKIRSYLVSGRLRGENNPKIKLQPEDATIYMRLLDDPTQYADVGLKKNPLALATKKIWEETEQTVNTNSRNVSVVETYLSMAEKVLEDIEFVIITAPSEAEAFRLFETLNDRGLALSAADLVKNKLFAKCGQDSPAHLEEVIDIWKEIIRTIGTTEIVDFLRYYWIAFQKEVRKQELYDAYQDYIRSLRDRLKTRQKRYSRADLRDEY